jgi:two-component system KDP operon response regulator KdpE
MHIAIIEQDELLAHILSFVARRRGHKTFVARTPEELPERLPFTPAAGIIALDRIDEESLARIEPLRERYPDCLMLLTTEYAPDPLPLAALKAGFRDVVRKPLHPHELIMRAELHAESRGGPSAASDAIRVGDLEIDLGHYTATKNARELRLTKLELRLLFCLVEHHGKVSPTERLLSFGWESLEVPDASLLKTHISHLRKKLRDAGGNAAEIRARHSLGYTLRIEAAA